MNKNSKRTMIISIAAIIFIFFIILIAAFGAMMDSNTSQGPNLQEEAIKQPVEAEDPTPTVVTTSELSMTGEEFVRKFNGKLVSFDGLIQGTSKLRGASNPHTQLLIGDESDMGNFADMSLFWINSGTSTFDDSLQSYAKDNSTPYETGVYPKVKVLAKVTGYDSTLSVVKLEAIPNVDGASPSVSAR